jgi:hypothetical protein
MKQLIFAILLVAGILDFAHAEMIDYKEMELGVLEPARNTSEFQRMAIKLNVCCAIEEKRGLEEALKEDMRYARKYGVINYGRRDATVQQIKVDDELIIEGKRDYKEAFGKLFNKLACKKIACNEAPFFLTEYAKEICQNIQQVASLNAPTLHYNYHKDRARADNEYTGQSVDIKGRITEIKKVDSGETVVLLKTKDEKHPVQAFLKPSDVEIADTLKPGNGVEVSCIGAGMVADDVIIKECSFVKQPSPDAPPAAK